jgi:hypothetical protein
MWLVSSVKTYKLMLLKQACITLGQVLKGSRGIDLLIANSSDGQHQVSALPSSKSCGNLCSGGWVGPTNHFHVYTLLHNK